MKEAITMTVGCDLGDKTSTIVMLNPDGEVHSRTTIKTTEVGFRQVFEKMTRARVALEVGTHSPWVSRLLLTLGHEVIVANARRVQLISQSTKKTDRNDAETLARLARVDPGLLSPIQHRSEEAQVDLTMIRARDAAVRSRTLLINSVRGLLKPFGLRAPSCSTNAFDRRALNTELPLHLRSALGPLLESIAKLSEVIRKYDREVEERAGKDEDAKIVRQIPGVGSLTALAFVRSLGTASRFKKSREVAPYLGLVPKRAQSGAIDKQLRITKAGDPYVRKLLVQCGHYILGPFGPDTDMRRFGLKLSERGGKSGKKRALVATARKLSVLMHRLWVTGEVYEPLGYRGKTAA